jgi:hypothetical protein
MLAFRHRLGLDETLFAVSLAALEISATESWGSGTVFGVGAVAGIWA